MDDRGSHRLVDPAMLAHQPEEAAPELDEVGGLYARLAPLLERLEERAGVVGAQRDEGLDTQREGPRRRGHHLGARADEASLVTRRVGDAEGADGRAQRPHVVWQRRLERAVREPIIELGLPLESETVERWRRDPMGDGGTGNDEEGDDQGDKNTQGPRLPSFEMALPSANLLSAAQAP